MLPPEVLGGLVEGLPLVESGVVLGGLEFGFSVVLLPGLVVESELLELPVVPDVAELSGLLGLPVVAEPVLGDEELESGVLVPGLLMVPLWPD